MSKELFLQSMKALLGDSYPAFESSLEQPPFRGVYVNELKCSTARFRQLFPFPIEPTPFAPCGFYLDPDTAHLGTHPLHHAGAFYAQEPSAMSAAAVLAAKPGEKVLDMCAAPGGKTAAIAAALGGNGLLWSNEYVKQRAFTLLSNCERMGVRNAVISNADSAVLAKQLPQFFDKVLVDAPCSGEGMLRREKADYEKWSPKNIALCARRQAEILHNAAQTLACGGELVYSTCTFNRTENEEAVEAFLATHPDFELLPIQEPFGSPGFGMPEARRIFPADGGEGHFVAKLKKRGEAAAVKYSDFTAGPAPAAFDDFYKQQFAATPAGRPCEIGGKIYITPPALPATAGIPIHRAGVLAGEMKGRRFVPAHQLYSAARAEDCRAALDLSLEDARLPRYLHGEEISAEGASVTSGYLAIMVEGIPLGFGKASGGKIKNHYPKGLRNLS